ncbi:acyl-coenzyme A thioesterase 13 [Drosophila montana]|uniref:acyl-coenzyme A thioesterase 13 n=1 Tax=Drosophila montana TaxID=40370 RepID=UPI00313B1C8F
MSAKNGVEMVKKVAEFISKGTSFDRVTQMVKITKGGEGRCVGEFIVSAEHLNRLGSLHGGLTATILDNVTTYALMSKGSHPGVTSSLSVSYLAAAKPGDCIEVDAKTLHAGRKMAYIECVLRNKADGKIIAKGGQTKYVDFNT